jgi:sulfur carrier protein
MVGFALGILADRARIPTPKMMAADRMRIQLNGDSFELPDGETVAGLLSRLELVGRRVAVELNQDIVPRSQHSETVLGEGDQIEVVHAIGGG